LYQQKTKTNNWEKTRIKENFGFASRGKEEERNEGLWQREREREREFAK